MDYAEIQEKRKQQLVENGESREEIEKAEKNAENQIAEIARKILSDKARERLNNVKLVDREKYMRAVQVLMYFYQNNPASKISDQQLKSILAKLSAKRETKIVRK